MRVTCPKSPSKNRVGNLTRVPYLFLASPRPHSQWAMLDIHVTLLILAQITTQVLEMVSKYKLSFVLEVNIPVI